MGSVLILNCRKLLGLLPSLNAVFFTFCLLCLSHTQAQAQLRSLVNPSFELNNPAGPGPASFEIITNASVVGWDSTTSEIELWDTNFNGVPAFSGNVFAEMNANVNGTLYQNICLVTGEAIGWTFAHRARSGGPATQTAIFQVATSSGTVLQSLATQNSTTANQIWNVNTGNTTYTGASGFQRVQFTTSNTGSIGNFLDGIQLSLRPFIQLSSATASGVESIASANVPTLLVTGASTTAFNVTVTITGGTAIRGTDYTTPGGGATFTVTVPAGTYNNSAIPLGITITNDTTLETNETINFSLSAGTGFTLGNTVTCGAAAQTSAAYNITDDDARVTLRKQWANAVVADDANVTISRSGVIIDTLSSDAGNANELDADTTPTAVVIGETLALNETLLGTNIGNYNGVVSCSGTSDSNLADGLTIGAADTAVICTYTNTRIIAITVSKISSILLDGISGTNHKSIPGATVRYCILASNPGTLPATSVIAIDTLPANMTYLSESLLSGTTCASASTIEDDNNMDGDETDPFGISVAGSTITGTAPVLAAGGTFAIVFNAIID